MRPSLTSKRSRAALIALALAAVLSGGAKCEAGTAGDPGTGSTGAAGTGTNLGTASDSLKQLTSLKVGANGTMSGYSRDRFPHWISQGNGCDTRDVVLKRDGKNVKATADCKITGGTWLSPYDQKTHTDAKDMDIDHVVPLAAAWRSGANKWTDDQRQQFANDLTRPQLLAVSLSTNRSKGDQDPSTWKPPSHDYWCEYAQRWITVKAYWQLTVTQDEQAALKDMLGTC